MGPLPPGPGGHDYGIPHFILEPGEGYSSAVLSLTGHQGGVGDSAMTDDGSLIALAVGGGNLELWSSNGTLLANILLAGETDARCGSPWGIVRILGDGHLFTLYSSCARTYSWNGTLVWESQFYGSVRYPEHGISSDGTHLVATDNYTALRVWNLSSGSSVRVDVEANSLMDFGITPDGKWLVTVGQEPYGAGTTFYKIDDTTGNATQQANFDRKGRLVFSEGSNMVFQNRWSGSSTQNDSMGRYSIDNGTVRWEEWPCQATPGSFERPRCPLRGSSIRAVSSNGAHFAWSDSVAPRWVEEDGSGNVSCAAVVRILDWDTPNGSRGFQVGPQGHGVITNNQGNCSGVHDFLRAWLADDGSARALSHTYGAPDVVHLTVALPNATAPFASGNYV